MQEIIVPITDYFPYIYKPHTWCWPTDPAVLGLTEAELASAREKIESFTEERYEHVRTQGSLYHFNTGGCSGGIAIFGNTPNAIIFLKKAVPGDNKSHCRWVYNVNTGKCYIARTVEYKHEFGIYNRLKKHPDIMNYVGEYFNGTKSGMIFPVYDGCLKKLVREGRPLTVSHYLSMFRQMVSQLQKLYQIDWQWCYEDIIVTFLDGTRRPYKQVLKGKLSHGDIKLANFLFKRESDAHIKVKVIDFERSAQWNYFTYAKDNESPDLAACLMELKIQGFSAKNICRANIHYGHHWDVWALGIVFVEMLNKGNTLGCIEDCLSSHDFTQKSNLAFLPQESISNEIRGFKKASPHKSQVTRNRLWDVILGMLQVEPKNRVTMNELLEQLTELERFHHEEVLQRRITDYFPVIERQRSVSSSNHKCNQTKITDFFSPKRESESVDIADGLQSLSL